MTGKPFTSEDSRINRSGRKLGSRNKTPEQIRKALILLLNENLEQLRKDIEELKPRERVTMMLQLAKLTIPPPLTPEKLNEEQLKELIDYLKIQNYETENDE